VKSGPHFTGPFFISLRFLLSAFPISAFDSGPRPKSDSRCPVTASAEIYVCQVNDNPETGMDSMLFHKQSQALASLPQITQSLFGWQKWAGLIVLIKHQLFSCF
jgi:hypothetical protein